MPTRALLDLLCRCADECGVGDVTYIVGGAPRDAILGHPVKDMDVVVEDQTATKAGVLANAIAKKAGLSKVHPDQYGVVHVGPLPSFSWNGVSLDRQKVEIVTARREKYDKSRKAESHKPVAVEPGTILEDLLRRDFTFNTLMWRLSDVKPDAPFEQIPVLDLIDRGIRDLKAGVVNTPVSPYETFEEDPSRILRAVRFAAKYDFVCHEDVLQSFKSPALIGEMRRLPWELLDSVLSDKILTLPYNSLKRAIQLLWAYDMLEVCFEMIPETRLRRVVDGVPDIHSELLLMRYKFPSTWRAKLTPEHLNWLCGREDEGMPSERLQEARGRFLKPPIDVVRLAGEHGLKGAAIGRAVEVAKTVLLEDPFMDPSVLEAKTRAALGASK